MVFQDTGRPKQFLGKAALKAGQISEGATAQVIRDDKGQARAIMVGSAPRGEGPLFTRGMVQKADPAKGVLVLKVSDQRGDREVEIRVTDETRFSSISAEGARKDFKGKAGLKAAQFQKGTRVSVLLEPDGAARVVLTTSPRPPEKGGK